MSGILVLSRDTKTDRRAAEDALLARAVAAGATVWLVNHLYHLAEDCALWRDLAAQPGPLAVASWLHPRPAEALMRKHGAWPAGSIAADLADVDEATWAAIAAALALDAAMPGTVVERDDAAGERWYPVIDTAKCVECSHCLQFCLFGVYGRDADGHLVASQPDRCKAGCPACSRICPQGAIIFPRIPPSPGRRARRCISTRRDGPCSTTAPARPVRCAAMPVRAIRATMGRCATVAAATRARRRRARPTPSTICWMISTACAVDHASGQPPAASSH